MRHIFKGIVIVWLSLITLFCVYNHDSLAVYQSDQMAHGAKTNRMITEYTNQNYVNHAKLEQKLIDKGVIHD